MIVKNTLVKFYNTNLKKINKLVVPAEYFYLQTPIFFIKSNISINNIFINLNFNTLYKYSLLTKYSLNYHYLSISDIFSYFNNNVCYIIYNWISLISELKIQFSILVNWKIFKIHSIQNIISSSCWCERELSEFTGLYLLNAKDSRKLLLDYSNVKSYDFSISENKNNYNSFFYDFYT